MDTVITVVVNTLERLILSALLVLMMTFLPVAWSIMLWCDGGVIAASAGAVLFVVSVFCVYCGLRVLWVDIPLSDSSALVF